MVIESTWGLGETVVGGQVEPDHFVVRKKDLAVIERKVANKQLALAVWTNGRAKLIDESRQRSAQDLAVRLFVADEKRFAEAHQTYAVDMMEHLKEFAARCPARIEFEGRRANRIVT